MGEYALGARVQGPRDQVRVKSDGRAFELRKAEECAMSHMHLLIPERSERAEWPLKHWQAFRCDVGVVVAGAASAVDPVEDGHGKEGWRLRASMRRAREWPCLLARR